MTDDVNKMLQKIMLTRDCVSMRCIPERDMVEAWMCRA